jgi:alginate O-acetyltransferase complex protein AlgI
MLFPSHAFLLLFLPLTAGIYHRFTMSGKARFRLLLASSLVFYTWWDPRFLPLLLGTIVLNWGLAREYCRRPRTWLVDLGIALNLMVIGCFKYANFLAESVLGLFGIPFTDWNIILPLGISFFTFQQVSYLLDLRRGQAPSYSLGEFAAYVSFFPQLIAGPIVRHNELIPQFAAVLSTRIEPECIARGTILFVLGLGKKVFLADKLAPIADAGFAVASSGTPDVFMAWQGATAYTFQLYFDFSGYSDMAMGLAAMFGFDLPLNFSKPYRAGSIREFWRTWHMTLSRFLRDYLYIPLGGSRRGPARTYLAALTTMLFCGLWHGAGWTFIAWGGLHGLAVCANRAWCDSGLRMPRLVAWALTFVFVVLCWVLFRAENFFIAANMFRGMFSLQGIGNFDDDAWLVIAFGAFFSIVGFSNVELARSRYVEHRAVAVLLGLSLVAVVLRIGQGRALEFIYFQF